VQRRQDEAERQGLAYYLGTALPAYQKAIASQRSILEGQGERGPLTGSAFPNWSKLEPSSPPAMTVGGGLMFNSPILSSLSLTPSEPMRTCFDPLNQGRRTALSTTQSNPQNGTARTIIQKLVDQGLDPGTIKTNMRLLGLDPSNFKDLLP
jgi:hypothetical protein